MNKIVLTQEAWFNQTKKWYDSKNNDKSEYVVFPKGGGKGFNMDLGSHFYFVMKCNDTNQRILLGRGIYLSSEKMKAKKAWKKYERKLGYSNSHEFYKFKPVKETEEGPLEKPSERLVLCIRLANIEWLKSPESIIIDKMKNQDFININVSNKEEKKLLKDIESKFSNPHNSIHEESDQETFFSKKKYAEGSRKLSFHKSIERNREIISEVKKRVWECEICTLVFPNRYGKGIDYIEAHHKIPLNKTGEIMTSINDIALLCANCHRAVHKKMVINENMTYCKIRDEIKKILRHNGELKNM
jgi:hypothetical protein